MLTGYHKIILFLYTILIAGVLVLSPELYKYGFSGEDTQSVFIAAGSLLGLLGWILLVQRRSFTGFSNFFRKIIYALAFAIPEELLFRGIVQGQLLQEIAHPVLLILTSSAIFAFAHAFNGARGVKLSQWNYRLISMTFLAGIPLGVIFFITNSLLIPTVLHALFLLTLFLFKKRRMQYGK